MKKNLPHKTKYLTKKALIEANEAAISEKRNRYLSRIFLSKLPEDIKYVVHSALFHTANEIRLEILIDGENKQVVSLDMSPLRYNTLPIVIVYEDGTVEMESEEEAESRRPYPNRQEWREIVTRKPIRRPKFSRNVLEAYGYQCAICDICIPELLDAAHIVPKSSGGDDSINNGICLCKNHHKAFDTGMIIIDTQGKIFTKNNLKVERSTIKSPSAKKDYPSSENLAKRLKMMNIN